MITNLKESIQPVSDFRKGSAETFKRLRQTHAPIILTQRGRSVAVLLDIDSYEELEYARSLRESYLKGSQNLREGKFKSHKDVIEKLEHKIKSHSQC